MALTKVCRADELADGTVRQVMVGQRPIAVVRCGGKVYAFNDRCPHKGGYLSDGTVHSDRGELICPWHRFRFRLEDGASVTNPQMVARSYPARLDGDEVVVEL